MPDPTKLAYLRALRASGATTDEQQGELKHADNVYGDQWWLTSRERAWFTSADAVGAFHREHHRWPRQQVGDDAENVIGRWLMNQRTAVRDAIPWMTPERRQYLEEVAPGCLNGRQPWDDTAAEAIDFTRRHNRLPLPSSKDNDERRLGKWVENQRSAHRAGLRWLTPERADMLDQSLPGWRQLRTPGRKAKTPDA